MPLQTRDLAGISRRDARLPPGAYAIHKKCGVYTQHSVAERVLEYVGWTPNADLSKACLLEPAAGNGAFVVAAANRLVSSFRRASVKLTLKNLKDRIRAFEIHPREALTARIRIVEILAQTGLSKKDRHAVAERWITIGDFLLADLSPSSFSHIVGNPPYVRWSKIPKSLKKKYEQRLPAHLAKGDLFLPFLDLSISYLATGGRLGFVCSNRWKFMAFAEDFRRLRLPEVILERDIHIEPEVAYAKTVDVYASIVVFRRRKQIHKPSTVRSERTLVDLGFTVRVGPALGCTPAFVLDTDDGEVESELLAPWIQAADIEDGRVRETRKRVIVMHNADGSLLRLSDFPQAAAHLQRFKKRLKSRAITRAGAVWYRPIDRIIASNWSRPKILVPELARIPRASLDHSGAIPSHGVYAIFGEPLDLDQLYNKLKDGGLARALEGIAPKVKGGYVRCYRRFLEKISLDY